MEYRLETPQVSILFGRKVLDKEKGNMLPFAQTVIYYLYLRGVI